MFQRVGYLVVESEEALRRRVDRLEEASRRAPSDVSVQLGLAEGLVELADVLVGRGAIGEALETSRRAVEAVEIAGRMAPEDPQVWIASGQAWWSVARVGVAGLFADLKTVAAGPRMASDPDALDGADPGSDLAGRVTGLVDDHRRAAAEFERATHLAPDDLDAWRWWAETLAALAGVQASLVRDGHEDAAARHRQAISAYAEAVRLAPADAEIHGRMAGQQWALARTLDRTGRHEEALTAARQAVVTFEQTLQLDPDHRYAIEHLPAALRVVAEQL